MASSTPCLSDSSMIMESTSTSDSSICRICQIGRKYEPLFSPCNCKGSMGLVHRNCLEKWLSQSNSDFCEICKFQFKVIRRPKSFVEWLRQTEVHDDRRHMLIDIICFLLLGPLALTSAWLCIRGAIHYMQEEDFGSWEAFGLIVLALVLFIVFVCWTSMSVRYHWRVWQIWRYSNFNICLETILNLPVVSPTSTDASYESFDAFTADVSTEDGS